MGTSRNASGITPGTQAPLIRTVAAKKRLRDAAPGVLTEKRCHALFDALAEGVVMIAADGRVIAANASAETVLGMNAREIERVLRRDEAWRAVREDGSDFPPRDFPVRKCLRTGGKSKRNTRNSRRRSKRQLTPSPVPASIANLKAGIRVPRNSSVTRQKRLSADALDG